MATVERGTVHRSLRNINGYTRVSEKRPNRYSTQKSDLLESDNNIY